CRSKESIRCYSVFPKHYTKPIFRKEEQDELVTNEKFQAATYLSFKPACIDETSSEFYDPLVSKFINYLIKQGKKSSARYLLERAFLSIKMIQLQAYNSCDSNDKEKIELDPKVILRNAVENAKPVMELTQIKRAGQVYKVPIPIDSRRSRLLAIRWLIQAAKEKTRTDFLYDRLAHELIQAHNNQGRTIKKKQELYKQCQANKSYAHFRW
ncbi:PREDICTED: 28S ribosomal protein S7, mitochondrial, partial [Ceratosolen solmsi marchali]|uniref:28S ribosomal protein S7, mitochondrial n=1 Tax=Ceratosolen solmsi marchali TaxID=326594 RepID=A0AAJ7DVA6_9HYME